MFIKDKKFIILGADGQLGREFERVLKQRSYQVIVPDESSADITDHDSMLVLFDSVNPDIVINCAAYSAVDNAEEDQDTAFEINAQAPAGLAGLCGRYDAFFVHYSTDYVFDGTKGDLYTEEDVPCPLNVYGQSKLEGERAVLEGMGDKCLVLRTSWVIGQGQQNFLYKLSQWAANSIDLSISSDEISVPTFTSTIVELTLAALEKGLSGLYHAVSTGRASRYDLARAYIKYKGMKNRLEQVPMAMFKTKAKRPLNAAMSNRKLSADLGIKIPKWEDALKQYIKTQ